MEITCRSEIGSKEGDIDDISSRAGSWDCEVSETDRTCTACRLKKCRDIGMKEEYLLV